MPSIPYNTKNFMKLYIFLYKKNLPPAQSTESRLLFFNQPQPHSVLSPAIINMTYKKVMLPSNVR